MPPASESLFRIPVAIARSSTLQFGTTFGKQKWPRLFSALVVNDISPGESCAIAHGEDGVCVLPARLVSVPSGMVIANQFDAQDCYARGDTVELLWYASGLIVDAKTRRLQSCRY